MLLYQKHKTYKTVKFGVLFIACLGLSACGFQLRGSVDLPASMSPVQIISERDTTQLKQALTARLQQAGVKVLDNLARCRRQLEDATQAEAACTPQTVIYLRDNAITQRNLNIASSVQQRMIEVEIKQTVAIEIHDAQAKVLVEPRYISLQRKLFYDERAPLALTTETQRVQRELQEDVLGTITRLLRVVLSRSN